MAGKTTIKRIRVTKVGEAARILTLSSRGVVIDGVRIFFVHRYNPPEFIDIVGKAEGYALAWLITNGWKYEWIGGK